ncbi:MAG TPA: hypothetical protein VIL57_07355 [Bacteroidia bacterium]
MGLIRPGIKKEKVKKNEHKLFIPPPPPKEVAKIREMLKQVEVWINSGEKELAEKHWMLIADECRKYAARAINSTNVSL